MSEPTGSDRSNTEPNGRPAVEARMSQRGRLCTIVLAALAAVGCSERLAASISSVVPVHSERTGWLGTAGGAVLPARSPSNGSSAGDTGVWMAPGAALRVVQSNVAADGRGAWSVRMSVDVTALVHGGFDLRPARFGLMGEGTLDGQTSRVPAIHVGAGDTVRVALAWRIRRDSRPERVDLIWRGENSTAAWHPVDVQESTPVSPWIRAFRSAQADERVSVTGVSEVHVGSETLVRFETTIINDGEEPIEVDRANFHVSSGSAPLELVTTSTTSGYLGSLTSYCGVRGAWLGEHMPILPGQSATGSVCFRRPPTTTPSAMGAALLQVSYGPSDAPAFNGHFVASS